MKYNEEKEILDKAEDKANEANIREIITKDQAESLVKLFPNIPSEYIIYLQEIGAGSFLQNSFMVYSTLLDLNDLGLKDVYPTAINLKFFGDNFAGDFVGFNLKKNDGLVIELWHDTGELNYTNKGFQKYIREQMQHHEDEPTKKSWWKFW